MAIPENNRNYPGKVETVIVAVASLWTSNCKHTRSSEVHARVWQGPLNAR